MARAIAVGVDVSLRRGLDVVALAADRSLAVPPMAKVAVDDLAGLLGALAPAAVGIDAPSGWGTSGASRSGERALARLGVSVYSTPSDPARRHDPFYGWVHVGVAAFAAANAAGYELHDGGVFQPGQVAEVFPHAAAVALHGHRPPAGLLRRAAGKRSWRLAALETAGIDTTALGSQDAIDAALAALSVLIALDGGATSVGDAGDGVIVVPGRPLPERYPPH
jgi:predicted nuclease with RNAse H fold